MAGATCQVNFAMAAATVDGGTGPTVTSGPGLLAAITGVFPAPGAVEVCADAQLRIAFASPAKAGKTRKIQVWQRAGMDGGTEILADSIRSEQVPDTSSSGQGRRSRNLTDLRRAPVATSEI